MIATLDINGAKMQPAETGRIVLVIQVDPNAITSKALPEKYLYQVQTVFHEMKGKSTIRYFGTSWFDLLPIIPSKGAMSGSTLYLIENRQAMKWLLQVELKPILATGEALVSEGLQKYLPKL